MQSQEPTMTEKNIGLNCHNCGVESMVTPRRAKRGECPNCHSTDTTVLDEIPEE
jgi:Zn finger protein HypA/HybF involved in hydrogenase expression